MNYKDLRDRTATLITIREWSTPFGHDHLNRPQKPLTDTLAPNKPYLGRMKDGSFEVVWWVVMFAGKGKTRRWIGSNFYFVKKPKASSQFVFPDLIWELPHVKYAKPRCITHDSVTGKKKPYHS